MAIRKSLKSPPPARPKIAHPNLHEIYLDLNEKHFEGSLWQAPQLRWNSRLRSAAGRFIPGNRLFRKPVIEVATYLLEEDNALAHIVDTLAHEMIHHWLWTMREPYGHTPLFHEKMREMGVSRYNPVPRLKPPRYLYRCPHCAKEFKVKRKLGTLACLTCCKSFAGGKFDPRFKLIFVGENPEATNPRAAPEISAQSQESVE